MYDELNLLERIINFFGLAVASMRKYFFLTIDFF